MFGRSEMAQQLFRDMADVGEKTGAEKILERRAKLAEQKKQRLANK